MQLARTQSITHVGRSGRQVPQWLMVGEVALRAATLAQPAALFVPVARPRHPGHRRLDHRRPRHRRARPGRRSGLRHRVDVGLHRAASAARLLLGRHSVPVPAHAVDPVHARRRDLRRARPSPAGRSTSSRPTPTSARRAKAPACCSRNMSSAASAGCGRSMRENRVTYISSRMSALLGRPASQLLGHSLPVAARRQCRARPGAAREAAVQLARDGAEDRARRRAGSRSPATRSSIPPAASRASAGSAPTSPRSARRRSG